MKPKCTKCKKKINKKDDVCPNCGADLKKQRKSANIAIVVFSLIFLSFFWMCSGDGDDAENGKREFSKLEALSMSQLFVKDRLKSPSSAEFGYGEDQVFQKNDSTFIVESYVDSQNSFGAMLRSKYVCTLYFDQEGTAHLIDLTMN